MQTFFYDQTTVIDILQLTVMGSWCCICRNVVDIQVCTQTNVN